MAFSLCRSDGTQKQISNELLQTFRSDGAKFMNNLNFVNENTFSLFVMLSIFGISLILGSIEAFVISRFGWTKFSKALVYAFISNYISAAVTALLSLILLVLVFVFLVQGAISCVFGCNDPRVVEDSAIPMAKLGFIWSQSQHSSFSQNAFLFLPFR